jgi:hypothetical protein
MESTPEKSLQTAPGAGDSVTVGNVCETHMLLWLLLILIVYVLLKLRGAA